MKIRGIFLSKASLNQLTRGKLLDLDDEKPFQERIDKYTFEYLNKISNKNILSEILLTNNNIKTEDGKIYLKSSQPNKENETSEKITEKKEIIKTLDGDENEISIVEKITVKERISRKIKKIGNFEKKSLINDTSRIQNVDDNSNDNSGLKLFNELNGKSENFFIK